MQKFNPETIEKGRLLTKLATDTLNWSYPNYCLRVRMNRDYLVIGHVPYNYINPDFFAIMKSNTKARRFHGYLEGDYVLATSGFYTNNIKGVARLVKKYPDMIESIQSHDQFHFANILADFMYKEGITNED